MRNEELSVSSCECGEVGGGVDPCKPEQLSLMKTYLSGHVVLMRVYVVGS